jgi:hypothetical protein
MEANEILTFSELIDLFDEGKLEGNHFIAYPTDRHKETDSRGYTTRAEIEAMSKIRKDCIDEKFKMLWKNGDI